MGNKTKKSLVKDLPREVVSEISRFISPNDTILACYETWIGKWGEYTEPTYSAQVITQDRVILYRREGKRNELASERLVDILGDRVEEDYGWSYIVQVPRGRSCYFASKQTAREFSDILRQAIRQAKETPQQTNLLNELERLATLHASGALTDSEFQNAKRKLGI